MVNTVKLHIYNIMIYNTVCGGQNLFNLDGVSQFETQLSLTLNKSNDELSIDMYEHKTQE